MTTKIVLFLATIGLPLMFSQCGGPKKVSSGKTEIQEPLSGSEYQSSEKYFRAVQSGKSPNLSTAKKIALQNAKSQLASNIQSTIKTVTSQYTNQRSIGDQQEYESKFEELTRNVVNQKLTDVKIIGSKVFEEDNGTYTYWVAVEASKDAILNGINSSISEDAKLQLEYDKQQFEKTFNEEMKKVEEEQP